MADVILVPPHSAETEEAVLGSLLIDTEAILKVAGFLQPENFYVVKNQWVYEAMLRLHDRREPIDLLTVSQELAKNSKLDEVGGESYIAQLTTMVPTALNVEAYGRAVESLSLRRKMITAAGDIARIAYDQTLPIEQVIEKSEATIFGVSEGRGEGHMVPIRKAVSDFFERIEYLHEHRDEPLGIPSGYGDLDKMTGGLQRGDLIIIAARPGVGKCVTGDTKVIDSQTGKLIDIESLVKSQQANLVTLCKDLKLHHGEAGGFLDDGIRPVYRVTTALGREIEATVMHPFLTMDGWKSLGLLKAGDHVAVPRIIPVFGDCSAPAHEAKVLAYLLADGCMTGNNPQFTNSNEHLREDFASAAMQFPGVKIRVETSKGTRTPTIYVSGDESAIQQGRLVFGKRLSAAMEAKGFSQHEVARRCAVNVAAVWNWVHGASAPDREHFDQLLKVLGTHEFALAPNGLPAISERGVNSLTAWLQAQGVWNKGAAAKFMPECVFQYTRELLALFLNRLFACDGSVYLSGERASISYSTISESLARSVQHLLLRFGILAKLRRRQVRYKGALRPAFELQITHRDSLLTFFDHIGALSKEPAIEKARAALMARQANANLDVIPADVWNDIAEAKGNRSWRSLFAEMGMSLDSNLHVGKRGLSRQRLAHLNAQLQSDKLARLANSDVYWDRIVSIEPAGEKQVYDLHVPATHNFIANDMVVHNTSLMLNMAYNAAHRHRQRVAIFSLEMSNEQLVQRFVAGETGIDSQRLRVADLREDEWGALTRVSMQMADTYIYLDDTPSLSPLDLRVKARRIYQEYGLDLIIVDYLQLMSGESGGRNDNRVQEISYISRSLKQIARELKVPLIAGSQLSRLVEQRSDKRPMLSDLRESGSIEQDSDIVMFIYRDEMYNPDTEFKNIAEISVQKNRNGPTGKAMLFFDKRLTAFKNLAKEKIEL
jgi:replicative DNA helicase